MEELKHYIRSYFGAIKADELDKMCSLFKFTTLKKGEYFLKQSHYCNKFCFIQSGYLRVFTEHKDKEITQWIASKGYFGTDLSSFYHEKTTRWNVQALVDSEYYFITKADYDKIPKIISNWHELEKAFTLKCFGMLEDRVFSFLSMSAEERYNFLFCIIPFLIA